MVSLVPPPKMTFPMLLFTQCTMAEQKLSLLNLNVYHTDAVTTDIVVPHLNLSKSKVEWCSFT